MENGKGEDGKGRLRGGRGGEGRSFSCGISWSRGETSDCARTSLPYHMAFPGGLLASPSLCALSS